MFNLFKSYNNIILVSLIYITDLIIPILMIYINNKTINIFLIIISCILKILF